MWLPDVVTNAAHCYVPLNDALVVVDFGFGIEVAFTGPPRSRQSSSS